MCVFRCLCASLVFGFGWVLTVVRVVCIVRLMLLMMICFKDGFAVGRVRCYRYALCSSRCGLFRRVGFDV